MNVLWEDLRVWIHMQRITIVGTRTHIVRIIRCDLQTRQGWIGIRMTKVMSCGKKEMIKLLYADQTSKIGGGSETFGAGAGLSATAYYYWGGDKSNFRSETLHGKGIEVAGSISARQVYISGAWGISQRDENGISTLSNTYGIGVAKSLLPIGLSVRKTNTTGEVKVK